MKQASEVKDDMKNTEDRKHEMNKAKDKSKTRGSVARRLDTFL
jgi:hypothetical protein